MQGNACLGVLLAALVVSGCDTEKGPPAGGGSTSPAATTAAVATGAQGNATAEQVAAEARDGLRCPPEIKTAPRAASAPVDDVLGVRAGQTYDEARNLVLCSHALLVASEARDRGFQIESHGQALRQGFEAVFAKPKVERTSRQIVQDMQDEAMGRGLNRRRQDIGPGQSRWYVGTLGMPGEEQVISVAREEWFEADRQPTTASVAQALAAKYGTAGRIADVGTMQLFSWTWDAGGRRLAEGMPLYAVCRGNPSPDAPTNLNPDCGLTIEASIHVLPANPGLAEYLRVSVVDQARTYAVHDATTEGLAQQESGRRAEQVKDAERNASAPQL